MAASCANTALVQSAAHARHATSTGLLLAASGVLAATGGTILAVVFGWPAVLDEAGGVVLPRFAADEAAIRAGFYLLLIPPAYALEATLTRPTAGTRAMTVFGVAGAMFQILGWLFQGVWAVFVGVVVLRAVGLPRWFGGLGLGLAAGWAVLVPGSAVLRSEALNALGQPLYTAWYVWLLVLGLVLVVRRVGPGPLDLRTDGARPSVQMS